MKIALLSGWYDQEREVSLKSAKTWINFLKSAKEDIQVFILPQDEKTILSYTHHFDLIIPLIHWKGGEDWYIISKIKKLNPNIPYLFSSPQAMKISFDKYLTNKIVQKLNLKIKVPYFEKAHLTTNIDDIIKKFINYPQIIIKPNQWGSSFDTFVLSTNDIDLTKKQIYNILKRKNNTFLIQQFIPILNEFSASIFSDRDNNPFILGISHIQYKKAFFDYEAKYKGASIETHYLLPEFESNFGKKLTKIIKDDLLNIYKHLKISTLARIDFVQDFEGNLRFLEINTIPGFTRASIYPSMAKKYFWSLTSFWEAIKKLYSF